MGLETGTYVNDLVVTNPPGTDPKSQGDDHLRLIKTVLKDTFAGFVGGVAVTGTDGGAVNAYTLTPATALPSYTSRLSAVIAPTITNTGASTLNISGLGAKDIRAVDGAALIAGDLVAGVIYLAVYNGTFFQLTGITKRYADQLAFSTALPAQAGNTGKFLNTDGTNANWTDTFGVAVNERKGADIASAGTINLTTATGNFVHITGTTTITAITIPSGAERTLVFDGVLTLTHNATTLILPTGANITTAAGDSCKVRGDGVGNARVVSYLRADGTPISNALKLLATLTPTAAANVDFLTTFAGSFDHYLIFGDGLKPASGTPTLQARFANAGSADAGSNYYNDSSLDSSGSYSTATTSIDAANATISSGKATNFTMTVKNANDATNLKSWETIAQGDQAGGGTGYRNHARGGVYPPANAISGIRFFWSGGQNFAAQGKIRVYGYNNS